MYPGSYSLVIYRGDTVRRTFHLWDDPAKTDPTDLTGVACAAQIRIVPGGKLLVDLDLAVTLPNIIDLTLSAEDSLTLQGNASWDLQLTYAGGDVVTVLAGPVIVTIDVTE